MERSIAATLEGKYQPVTSDLARALLINREQDQAANDDGSLECMAVIRDFPELPEAVRTAEIARIEGRLLNRRLLRQLISQTPPPNSETGWSTRILKREESLLPHIGKLLYCVLIRLPGVQYTLEVDIDARAVVHWEWQAA